MAVTRGKVSIFLRQLLGFQPDPAQRGCEHDLIPRRSFTPGRRRNRTEKWVSMGNDSFILNISYLTLYDLIIQEPVDYDKYGK